MRALALTLTLMALVSTSSCSVDARYGSTRFRCGDGRCPVDYQCVNGFCEATTPTDGGLGDAAAPDDGGSDATTRPDGASADAQVIQPPCGSVGLLADDFDDGVRGEQWEWSFTDAPAMLAETAGVLTVVLAGNTMAGTYAGYTSDETYDLHNDRVSVELVRGPNMQTQAQAIFVVSASTGNLVQFVLQGGLLFFQKRVGGAPMVSLGSINYNANPHRFLALRVTGANTYWETSPNGTDWTVRASDGLPINYSFVRVSLSGGTYQAETLPGLVIYDNLNGGTPRGRYCPAAALRDNFDDSERSPAWSRWWANGGCMVGEGGSLTMTPAIGSASYCAYQTSTSYDLTGSTVTVEVPQMVNTGNDAYVSLFLTAPTDRFIEIVQQMGSLVFKKRTGGITSTLASLTYSATNHRWWRFREAAGRLYWETSPDGSQWTPNVQENAPFSLTDLDIALEAGAPPSAVANPGAARFDNYNSPP